MSLARSYQQHLDRIARVNPEFYTCDSCEDEFDVDGMCEHDDTIHNWCVDCCEAFYQEDSEPLSKEDLD